MRPFILISAAPKVSFHPKNCIYSDYSFKSETEIMDSFIKETLYPTNESLYTPSSNKIETIKAVRFTNTIGLKEAKEFVEFCFDRNIDIKILSF